MGSIADDLDYSKSWVSRINSRAIQKIRDHINVEVDS